MNNSSRNSCIFILRTGIESNKQITGLAVCALEPGQCGHRNPIVEQDRLSSFHSSLHPIHNSIHFSFSSHVPLQRLHSPPPPPSPSRTRPVWFHFRGHHRVAIIRQTYARECDIFRGVCYVGADRTPLTGHIHTHQIMKVSNTVCVTVNWAKGRDDTKLRASPRPSVAAVRLFSP